MTRCIALSVACLLAVFSALPLLAHESSVPALQRLDSAILEDPGNPVPYLQRSEQHRLAGSGDAALKDLDQAEVLGADSLSVVLGRAAVFFDSGRYRETVSVLDGVSPSSSSVRVLRARAYRGLGRFPAARQQFLLALHGTPHPPADLFLEAARCVLLAEADVLRAISILEDGMRRRGPVGALVHAALDLETAAGDHAAALRRLDRIPRPSVSLLKRRGEILLAAGRPLEAQAVFTGILARVENLPPHRRAAPAMRSLEEELREALRVERGGRP